MSNAVRRGARGTQLAPHDADRLRAKIDTSYLITRLTQHVKGELDMSATQVAAAKLLMDRTIPTLSASEIKQQNTNYVARLPSPAKDADTWLASVRPTEPRTATEGDAQSPSKAKH